MSTTAAVTIAAALAFAMGAVGVAEAWHEGRQHGALDRIQEDVEAMRRLQEEAEFQQRLDRQRRTHEEFWEKMRQQDERHEREMEKIRRGRSR